MNADVHKGVKKKLLHGLHYFYFYTSLIQNIVSLFILESGTRSYYPYYSYLSHLMNVMD